MRSFRRASRFSLPTSTPTEDGYDFSELKDMIDWRDGVH